MRGWLVYGIVSLGIPSLWVVLVYLRDWLKKAIRRRQDHDLRIERLLDQVSRRQKEEEQLWSDCD